MFFNPDPYVKISIKPGKGLLLLSHHNQVCRTGIAESTTQPSWTGQFEFIANPSDILDFEVKDKFAKSRPIISRFLGKFSIQIWHLCDQFSRDLAEFTFSLCNKNPSDHVTGQLSFTFTLDNDPVDPWTYVHQIRNLNYSTDLSDSQILESSNPNITHDIVQSSQSSEIFNSNMSANGTSHSAIGSSDSKSVKHEGQTCHICSGSDQSINSITVAPFGSQASVTHLSIPSVSTTTASSSGICNTGSSTVAFNNMEYMLQLACDATKSIGLSPTPNPAKEMIVPPLLPAKEISSKYHQSLERSKTHLHNVPDVSRTGATDSSLLSAQKDKHTKHDNTTFCTNEVEISEILSTSVSVHLPPTLPERTFRGLLRPVALPVHLISSDNYSNEYCINQTQIYAEHPGVQCTAPLATPEHDFIYEGGPSSENINKAVNFECEAQILNYSEFKPSINECSSSEHYHEAYLNVSEASIIGSVNHMTSCFDELNLDNNEVPGSYSMCVPNIVILPCSSPSSQTLSASENEELLGDGSNVFRNDSCGSKNSESFDGGKELPYPNAVALNPSLPNCTTTPDITITSQTGIHCHPHSLSLLAIPGNVQSPALVVNPANDDSNPFTLTYEASHDGSLSLRTSSSEEGDNIASSEPDTPNHLSYIRPDSKLLVQKRNSQGNMTSRLSCFVGRSDPFQVSTLQHFPSTRLCTIPERTIKYQRMDVEDPLPPHWETRIDSQDHIFYIDHQNRTTTWTRPTSSQQLTLKTASEWLWHQLNRRYQSIKRTIVSRAHENNTTTATPICSPITVPSSSSENQRALLLQSPAFQFLTRPDFLDVLHMNDDALAVYNRNSSLKHMITKIQMDLSGFERYQNNRDLISFLNKFADTARELPRCWETKLDNAGKQFFIDCTSRSTTFIDPRLPIETSLVNPNRLPVPSARRSCSAVEEEISPDTRARQPLITTQNTVPPPGSPAHASSTMPHVVFHMLTAYEEKVVAFLQQPNIMKILKERYPTIESNQTLQDKVNTVKVGGIAALNRLNRDGDLTVLLNLFEQEIMSFNPAQITSNGSSSCTNHWSL